MDIADIYVPVKSETTKAEVADADITAGKTTINVQLPDEFKPEYSVDGLDVSVEGKVLTFKAATESRAAASVKPGKYTLTIKDKKNKYADVVTTFTLTTKDMPAAYDEENKKLVEAEGFDTDALKAYLGNITSVNVAKGGSAVLTAKQTNVARVIIDPTPVQVVLTDDASDNLTIKTKGLASGKYTVYFQIFSKEGYRLIKSLEVTVAE